MIKIDYYKTSTEENSFEIVERKGIGHPDTICDAIVDRISVELAKIYKRQFGRLLHFNIDKALLSAGMVEKGFGWGKVIKPITLYIGDRATFTAGGNKIDIDAIVINTAKTWFLKHLPNINVERDVVVKSVLSQGSQELVKIFTQEKGPYLANDTSAAVGYYPLSHTEKVVFLLEQYLNSKEFKKAHPDTGEDVKVMGLRHSKNLELTIAMPFLAKKITSERQYFSRKMEIGEAIKNFLLQFKHFEKIKINLNALDSKDKGLNGVYLSLLGTSAEDADSGEVGRGNKVNGVIAITRPIGTEAAAGKNPVSHVGKIYNVFSHYLAKTIYTNTEGLKEVYVYLLSEIGKPIDQPKLIGIRLASENHVSKSYIHKVVKEIVGEEFSKISDFCMSLSMGKYNVY